MAQQLDIIGVISDDMSIAQGLLGRSNIPLRRKTSFTSTSRSYHTRDTNEQEDTVTKDGGGRRRIIQSSNTWTASSGELLSDLDDTEDRTVFVQEYNRLAKKHGVRPLLPEEHDSSAVDHGSTSSKPSSWFSRKILRRTSSTQSVKQKPERLAKHRRSISDLSLRFKPKSDALKDKDLQELVRLCGVSLLYLPTEYAATSLSVPTCFRATAQYLVQHASTSRGVFRIPGSHNVVAALYNHYCTMDEHGSVVAGTVRCPTLPEHIRCDVHDVASAFKKFISGLPGGILGSLPLFDAFISIQSQLSGVPELTRTKQGKVRARLIALAISTLRSQYRRELICAVFGLLSMIGRAAEIAPRENERGRPLPTSDLMGYSPLGIVFGPLLIGNMLENYTICHANPHRGLVLFPISPPKSRKERNKKNKTSEDCSAFNTHVDKIKIANSITEMLITQWRDVVRHMRNLKALKIVRSCKSLEVTVPKQPFLRPSASESFALRKPPDWNNDNSPIREIERCESPTPASRRRSLLGSRLSRRSSPKLNDTLTVRKQRSRPRHSSSQMLSSARSMSILSPTQEENPVSYSLELGGPSSREKTPRRPSTTFLGSPRAASPGAFEMPKSGSALSKVFKERDSKYHGSEKKLYRFSDNPPAANTGTSRLSEPDNISLGPLVSQPKRSYNQISPFSDKTGTAKLKTYDRPENDPLKTLSEDGSQAPQEHALDGSPAEKPKYLLKQNRLMGPRAPEPPAPCHPYPDIALCTVACSYQARLPSGALRRISASEPGLCPNISSHRSIRHSKSNFVETEQRNIIDDWLAPKDPLSRVSTEEDLASLTALAHALEEQSAEPQPDPSTSKTPKRSGFYARSNFTYSIAELAKVATYEETRGGMTKKKADFAKLVKNAVEEETRGTLTALQIKTLWRSLVELRELEPGFLSDIQEASSKANKSIELLRNLDGKPRAIEGPNYSHLSGRTPSPKKKSLEQFSTRSGIPANVRHASPIVSSVEVHTEKSDESLNNSPRVSVKALAAKFNTSDSRSLSAPSPAKSLSKTTLVNVRAVSDSPKEKVVSSYMINPPSPTKSSKSGKSEISLESACILSSLDHKFAKPSPPRRLLRSNLNDSTPLRSVRKSIEEVESALKAPDLPPCCSPLSLYDGASVQFPRMGSYEPIPCPMSPHTYFEPIKMAQRVVATSNLNGTLSIPMAISPLMSTTPTRSNSLLHTQTETIQQQLKSKAEQTRHLKRQMCIGGDLDIGALYEELREAKREAQVWKTRAEVAEKQLEVMVTLSSRYISAQNISNPSSVAAVTSTSLRSRTVYDEDGFEVSNRARRAFYGMDGANSQPCSSESSTDTVIRDIQ